MNKPLRRIAIFCGLLVLALLVRDNWIQLVQADELKTDPKNRRVAIARYAQPRGNIIVDGKAITGSTDTKSGDFRYKRTYKNGPMWAPVTGYASQAFGANQIEALKDGILTGDDDRLFFNRTIDMLTGKPQKGGNVVTTLNAKAQKAAFDGLGDKQGRRRRDRPARPARSWRWPARRRTTPPASPATATKDTKAWSKLQKKNNEDEPMLNRALRQTYPPGSTFKVVTAAAGLESGKYDLDKATDTPGPVPAPDSQHRRWERGQHPLQERDRAPARCGSPATPSSRRWATPSATRK